MQVLFAASFLYVIFEYQNFSIELAMAQHIFRRFVGRFLKNQPYLLTIHLQPSYELYKIPAHVCGPRATPSKTKLQLAPHRAIPRQS